MNVEVSAEALIDLEQAADWYLDQAAGGVAQSLHREVGIALARIADMPGIGTPGPAGTRTLPVHRFPMSLVYRVDREVVRVIAVAAHRRRPGYWEGRSGLE